MSLDMYGDDECVGIKTLNEEFLSSFRLNEKVTITVRAGEVTKTLTGTVEKIEATEDYESYDYNPSTKSDKKVEKTRPGCLKIVIGDDPPEPASPPDMVARMEADDEDDY